MKQPKLKNNPNELPQRLREEDCIKEPLSRKKSWWWILLLVVIAVVSTILCINKCTEKETPKVIDEPEPVVPVVKVDTQKVVMPELSQSTSELSQPTSELSQPIVEEKHNESKSVDVKLMAKRVIRGDFGNGSARKKALENEYQTIQDQVNINYRNGDLYW